MELGARQVPRDSRDVFLDSTEYPKMDFPLKNGSFDFMANLQKMLASMPIDLNEHLERAHAPTRCNKKNLYPKSPILLGTRKMVYGSPPHFSHQISDEIHPFQTPCRTSTGPTPSGTPPGNSCGQLASWLWTLLSGRHFCWVEDSPHVVFKNGSWLWIPFWCLKGNPKDTLAIDRLTGAGLPYWSPWQRRSRRRGIGRWLSYPGFASLSSTYGSGGVVSSFQALSHALPSWEGKSRRGGGWCPLKFADVHGGMVSASHRWGRRWGRPRRSPRSSWLTLQKWVVAICVPF